MSPGDRERFSRQILFPGIGERGQERLFSAHVAIVGCGALGSFQAAALARAGVGRLTIIDRDYVETSNLQRQWLFNEADAAQGLPKAAAAERQLKRINSSTRVDAVVGDLDPSNVSEYLAGAEVILDGTDNFETRYLINDYSVLNQIPWIYGAALGSYGVTMPVLPGHACFKCVYPNPPSGAQPTCETAGILNSITSLIASLQVAFLYRVICGQKNGGEPHIATVDVWKGEMRQLQLPSPDARCPACGLRDFSHLRGAGRAPISLCGRNAVQIHERSRPIDLAELRTRLQPLGEVRSNEFALRFFPTPYEMTVFPDGRAIIKGTTDTGLARSLYAKYLGS